MSITLIPLEPGFVGLAVGCSDAHIRVYTFDETLGRLNHLFISPDLHRCILDTERIMGVPESDALIASGGTDGTLRLWDLSHELKSRPWRACVSDRGPSGQLAPAFFTSVRHQSGINGIACRTLDNIGDNYTVAVVTVGDDNALSAVLIEIDGHCETASARMLACTSIIGAHTAAITAVKFIGAAVLTASTDERLSVWNLSITVSADSSDSNLGRESRPASGVALALAPVGCTMISFSDVQALAVMTVDKVHSIAVGGFGIQMFDIVTEPP